MTKTYNQKKSSAHLFITLTRKNGVPLDGTKDEIQEIQEICKKITYYIASLISFEIGGENDSDGLKHYHIYMYLDRAVNLSAIESGNIYKAFRRYSGEDTRLDIQFSRENSQLTRGQLTIGYVCKDRYERDCDGNLLVKDGRLKVLSDALFLDDFDSAVTVKNNVETKIITYQKIESYVIDRESQEAEQRRSYKNEKTKAKSKFELEQDMITFVSNYMIENEISVNSITRELNMDEDDFFRDLHNLGFEKNHGLGSIEMIKKLIHDRAYYSLPEYRPDEDLVKYKNCYLKLSTNSLISLGDKKYNTRIPMYEVDEDISDELPVTFISMIERNKIDLEEFRRAYSVQLRPKQKRDRSMLIWGPPYSGKSSMLYPFTQICKSVCVEIANDGGFTWSNIAQYPKAYSEEFDFFDPVFDIQVMKKVLEGLLCNVKAKHGAAKKSVPKSIIGCSNYEPPNVIEGHYGAINDRLFKFQTHFRVKDVDNDLNVKLESELGKIISWCMKKDASKPWEIPC